MPTLSALVFALAAFGFAAAARAQINSVTPTIPGTHTGTDVTESEEVVPDTAFLPVEQEGEPSEETQSILDTQEKELGYSQEELRTRFQYGIAVSVGAAHPWQIYGIETTAIMAGDWQVGAFAGGGGVKSSGRVDEKAYDLALTTRSFGLTAQYHMERLEHLGVTACIGYAAWDGTFEPHGSDDDVIIDEEKLGASFRAHGPFVGVAAVLTWLWESGFYLEWVPVGARRSKIAERDLSRESPLVNKAVEQTIQTPAFYGLTDIKIGWLF